MAACNNTHRSCVQYEFVFMLQCRTTGPVIVVFPADSHASSECRQVIADTASLYQETEEGHKSIPKRIWRVFALQRLADLRNFEMPLKCRGFPVSLRISGRRSRLVWQSEFAQWQSENGCR